MTPRQLDPDTVLVKLELMRAALDVLDQIGDLTADQLRSDAIRRGAVERYLSQLVDLAGAVNAHVSSAVLGEAPTDYTDSFHRAARAGTIGEDLAASLAPSAGLRNVIVHDYAVIDLGKVAAAVPLARRDFRHYIQAVARFLTDR